MANRLFNQFQLSLEKQVVHLFGKVSIGAAGAPTLTAASSKGVKSITRTGAGAYDIVLGVGSNVDVYNTFLGIEVGFIHANPASPVVHVVSESVATPTTGKISIQCRDYAGAATDPGNGEIMVLNIKVKNSNAQ